MKSAQNLEDALAEILAVVRATARHEQVAVDDLAGRVLAEPLTARSQLPGHTQSAMDGYAVIARTAPTPSPLSYRPVGTSWAGQPYTGKVRADECVRIFTGAVLPPDCNAVLLQENVEVTDEQILTHHTCSAGEHVREAGEDLNTGDLLAEAGTRIQSHHLGAIIATGHQQAQVFARPRVACFSNGDELRPAGTTLQPGEVYDSNRLVLRSALHECGADVTRSACLPDQKDHIRDTLRDAAGQCDLIVTSGGASVGDADHLVDVASELGEIQFWKLPIKPGKPVLFSRINNTCLLALPGNPVSSWVTFRLLVRPLLALLEGRPLLHPRRVPARLIGDIVRRPGRAEYQRGILAFTADGGEVHCAGPQGSHRLGVLAAANCLIEFPAASTGAQDGEQVMVLPFSELNGPL